MTTKNEANLGLATTQELFDELFARLGVDFESEMGARPAVARCMKLQEVLLSLPYHKREYKTVGDF